MQQVSKQIYDYLLRNDPEELWIEWNGTLPISVLQTLFPPAKKQDGGTPGDFCQLQLHAVPGRFHQTGCPLQQTGGMALEQIPPSDVIVLRNWGPVSQFKNRKRMLRELNPGVKVLPLNSVGTVERAMLRPGRQPAFWFLLGIAYFTAAYLTLRMVIGAGGNLADAVVNVFLGILLQAFPFLLIGVLLSSAIQIFVSQSVAPRALPKASGGRPFVRGLGRLLSARVRLRLSSGVPKPGSEGRPPCCRRYLSDGRTGHQSGGHSSAPGMLSAGMSESSCAGWGSACCVRC